MVKSTIKVCIRTRPTQVFAKKKILIDVDQNNIQIQTLPISDLEEETTLPLLCNNKQNTFKFHFDNVFHNATQAEVYDSRARSTGDHKCGIIIKFIILITSLSILHIYSPRCYCRGYQWIYFNLWSDRKW